MPTRRIYADINALFTGASALVLDADVAAGASTITVKNITGVAINKILFFRTPGSENAEIIATHASTTPTGTTVTLAATLVRSHPAGTLVFVIPANQVRFYYASAAVNANSDDSTLTALASAQAVDPTMPQNIYDDTTQTSGYYFYRFIDSINSVNGLYSDAIPWGASIVQFLEDEVGFILESVRSKLCHEWDERFSKQTAFAEINACLRYMQGKLKRYSRFLVANYALGSTARGTFEFTLPDNIYDNETNKSILSVRVGSATNPLIPLDEKEFDQLLGDVAQTTVRTQPAIGATSLDITNSFDFDDSGTIHIYTSGTLDEITYTGVTRSATAGVLTGIPASGDGSIAATHAVGTNVWQGEVEGEPRYFNVRSGSMRTYPTVSSTWKNKKVVLDYYQEVTKVDSESDSIDMSRYDAVKHWLLWQGKAYWRNNGKADVKDDDFIIFSGILKDQIRTEVSGQKGKMRPAINTISYRPNRRGTSTSFETS